MRTDPVAKFPTLIRGFISRVLKATSGKPDRVRKAISMLNDVAARRSVEPIYIKVKAVSRPDPQARPQSHQREARTAPATTVTLLPDDADPDGEPDPAVEAVIAEVLDDTNPLTTAPLPAFITGAREVCVVHGWVGQHAFYKGKHDTCGIDLAELSPDDIDTSNLDEEDPEDLPEEDPEVIRARRRRKSPRQLGLPRKMTVPTKQLTKSMLKTHALKLAVAEQANPIGHIQRPQTRADCVNGPRPCAWVSCRHHLYLEINGETGSITFNRPDQEPDEMEQSCSLDVADEGDHTLEQVGFLVNVTRERVRQLEVPALSKLRAALAEIGVTDDDD